MAKINRPTSIQHTITTHPQRTTNFEGGLAFAQSPELRLYRMACTSLFGEDKFYQTAAEHDQALIQAVSEVNDVSYLLKLARYVRNDMHLRTIPVVLLAEAAHKMVEWYQAMPPPMLNTVTIGKPDFAIRQYAPLILRRVDDCTECLAYWLNKYGKPIPNALKRGIADALSNFDEYQLAKYRAEDKAVKLRDVIRLCARHLIKEGNAFHKAVAGTLRSEGTWEVEISSQGNTKAAWEGILPRMGIMAVLRNLRNMLQVGVNPEAIKAKFTDQAILNSKQLPFRWYSAWKVIYNDFSLLAPPHPVHQVDLLDLLENAMTISCQNIPRLSGTTAIFIDHSGSMDTPLSKRSTVEYFEIGAVLGAIAQYICDQSIVGLFGEVVRVVHLRQQAGILNNIGILQKTYVGHSTNAWTCINQLNAEQAKVDRIIILTDEQVYNSDYKWSVITGSGSYTMFYSELVKYRRTVNPKVKTYILDLAGYQTACTPEDDNGVIQLAGWSDKIFAFVKAIEADPKEVLRKISQ